YAPDGYNRYFEVSTEAVTVLLSTKIDRYDIPNRTVWLKGEKKSFDVIVNAISPDELFDRCHGELRYIGCDFHKMSTYFQSPSIFSTTLMTRRSRALSNTTNLPTTPTTLVGMEIPSMNGRHYPLPFKADRSWPENITQ